MAITPSMRSFVVVTLAFLAGRGASQLSAPSTWATAGSNANAKCYLLGVSEFVNGLHKQVAAKVAAAGTGTVSFTPNTGFLNNVMGGPQEVGAVKKKVRIEFAKHSCAGSSRREKKKRVFPFFRGRCTTAPALVFA